MCSIGDSQENVQIENKMKKDRQRTANQTGNIMKSYKELKEFIIKKIDEGEMFLSIDIKPSFDDTPDYWETDLENLFTSPRK